MKRVEPGRPRGTGSAACLHLPGPSCQYGRQRGGASWYGVSARTVRRNMTDTPSWGEGEAGDQERDQGPGEPRQPWFPPGSQAPPGAGYGVPPGAVPPGTGYGQGGYGPPGYGPPGYGAPRGGWAPPPQAPKPGVIPLRPVAVGEILDGAFTSI